MYFKKCEGVAVPKYLQPTGRPCVYSKMQVLKQNKRKHYITTFLSIIALLLYYINNSRF